MRFIVEESKNKKEIPLQSSPDLKTESKVNLLNFSRDSLAEYLLALGEKPFRAGQLIKWIHQMGETTFDGMTNLSKALRQKLADHTVIQPPEVVWDQASTDGTHKWLIRLFDSNCIEMVFIPEKNRGTLCISSQVGCGLNCSFCATARQGFNRNLSIAEIIGQVFIAYRRLSQDGTIRDRVITNVVLMGMGEPLLNFDNVVQAMDLMMDDFAYNLSKYRVTLSTSGLIPQMQLLKERSLASLAVSLHAPNDLLRNELVPLNKKYPLQPLMEICKNYYENEPRRVVTFEYVMLANVNDTESHANELVKLLRNIPCKVNLIPFNNFPNSGYKRSSSERIEHFQKILIKSGLNTRVRKTRGSDIDGACGQLTGRVNDRTRRSSKYIPISAVN